MTKGIDQIKGSTLTTWKKYVFSRDKNRNGMDEDTPRSTKSTKTDGLFI